MAVGRLDVRREGSQKKRGRWSGDGKDVDRCLKEAKKRGTFQIFLTSEVAYRAALRETSAVSLSSELASSWLA